jgi:hypothetical protein
MPTTPSQKEINQRRRTTSEPSHPKIRTSRPNRVLQIAPAHVTTGTVLKRILQGRRIMRSPRRKPTDIRNRVIGNRHPVTTLPTMEKRRVIRYHGTRRPLLRDPSRRQYPVITRSPPPFLSRHPLPNQRPAGHTPLPPSLRARVTTEIILHSNPPPIREVYRITRINRYNRTSHHRGGEARTHLFQKRTAAPPHPRPQPPPLTLTGVTGILRANQSPNPSPNPPKRLGNPPNRRARAKRPSARSTSAPSFQALPHLLCRRLPNLLP